MTPRLAPKLKWRDLVHLQPRYRRSIHLERDYRTPEALAGYVVTPLVRATLARVADGVLGAGTRAWSFTGPYGSGKSAFAVFVANLFHPSNAHGGAARKMLEAADPELHRKLFAGGGAPYLCPVLATGERKSLEAVVMRALADAASGFWAGTKRPKLAAEIERAAGAAERGDRLSAREVVRFVERFAEKLSESTRRGGGVLLLIDEAGKTLEFAAHHPDRADVHLLQELAELASRSGDHPVIIGVLLHQAFEQYASRLGTAQRNEWAKVQGRFENVPFQEAADQILRLVALALGLKGLPPAAKEEATGAIEDLVASVNLPGIPDKERLARVLVETLPLHPVTALALGPLFRSQISQNERSLFAFLSSSEPGAFQAFLDAAVLDDGLELYRPHRLFDYLAASFGERLYRHGGRGWALINDALSRLPQDASELDARVVKTVGLLGLLGENSGIPASERVLQLAVAAAANQRRDVSSSLARLRAASVLVYRKFRDSYQVWDGSDLNLDERIRTATSQFDPRARVTDLLNRAVPPRPLVARRHLFETGTLRYFEVRYGDESALDGKWDGQDTEADGVVWLIVPSSDGAAQDVKVRLNRPETWLGHGESSKPVVVGVMNEAGRLREAAVELAALEWVRTHTPELASDPVARKELAGRILDAENVLRREMSAFITGDRGAIWNCRGTSLPVLNGRQLGTALSAICTTAYEKAPHIFNELINRSQLSSAAAAARRELLAAMSSCRHSARLGISGAPPELSMYRSVLEKQRLHRATGGRWDFSDPVSRSGSVSYALRAIEKALGNDGSRVPLRKIYEVLARPPYGVKEGLIPVLVLWTLLQHEAEIAVYEEGAFVPVIDGPVIERFARRPERFDVQRFKIAGAREELFGELTGDPDAGDHNPLALVRQFVRTVQDLPTYARNTREVSDRAVLVRDAILRAKEPGTLVFRDLPVACGFEPLSGKRARELPAGLVEALQASLKELRTAYPQLLDRIGELVFRAFTVAGAPEQARRELSTRAKQLSGLAADQQLRTFLVRASDEHLDLSGWTVSIGTLLGGRPPETWADADVQRMSVQLTMVARKFAALEAAFLEHQQAGMPEGSVAVRVAVTEAGKLDAERVVLIRRENKEQVATITQRLREAVQAEQADAPREALVAGLAQLMRDLIAEMGEDAQMNEGAKE